MGNHGDVLVDDSVDKSRVDKPRTLVEFRPRTLVEFELRTLVEFRSRILVEFEPMVESGERTLVEFSTVDQRALVELADTSRGGSMAAIAWSSSTRRFAYCQYHGEGDHEAEVLLQVPEGWVQARRQLPIPSRSEEHAEQGISTETGQFW